MRFIKYYRLLRGLTQGELAVKANVSQPKISELEMGEVHVSNDTLNRIAVCLNFPHSTDKLLALCPEELNDNNIVIP